MRKTLRRTPSQWLPRLIACAIIIGAGISLMMLKTARADVITLVTNDKIECRIIEETPEKVIVERQLGGQAMKLTLQRSSIRSIERSGGPGSAPFSETPSKPKTESSAEKPTPTPTPAAPAPKPQIKQPPPVKKPEPAAIPESKSAAEIRKIVEAAGATPPAWWDRVRLDVPAGLDLTWKQSNEGWKPNKYLGAYIVSVLNPNPNRWQGGIKLLHHVATVNKDDPQKLKQSLQALGQAYHNYEADFARAAYYWEKGNADPLQLAECYWRLGGKDVARELLERIGADNTRNGAVIKMWANIGELDIALRLAKAKSKTQLADVAYLAAGDVLRQAGRFTEAVAMYEQVLATKNGGRGLQQNKRRAGDSLAAIKIFEALDLTKIPDGSYKGSSPGYRGPVEVMVSIKGGKIIDVRVVSHREDWAFTAITEIPQRIMRKQGVKDVDTVSGATFSSEAIINGAARAIGEGMKNRR